MKRNITTCILVIFCSVVLHTNALAQGLTVKGTAIVDANGNEVILRGMGLGGWMLQEAYMLEMSDFAGPQWQIKSKIESLIGVSNTEAFYDAWRANHCTKADIDSLAAWGFNSVRLPMHYNLFTLPIEQEPIAGANTWLKKGFDMTDSLIKWCAAHRMYVILDLHATPGGQGKDAAISDYDASKPSLWESDANKQKIIALWRKLAEHYANETWVGGYDLINEPNWSFTAGGNQNGCSEELNAPLRQLYMDITAAIRQVDKKHIIIIEGNCWGNRYNGMLPPWDNNMVLSFHKYWSNNDQNAIQGILDLRNQYNIPIWLGESGENSNAWFTDAIKLVEKNKIGWAWWPLKKIGSVVNPLTVTKTPEYTTLLNYLKNGGTKPTVEFAQTALMQITENLKIQNCTYRRDVIDAMFRQVKDTNTLPFKNVRIPGVVHVTDFDLGNNGFAYSDKDVATYHVSNGSYTAWNNGWIYRNDGVDIEKCTDTSALSNGYNIGWTNDNEWTLYTVTVDSTAAYNISVRYASAQSDAKISLMRDNISISSSLLLPSTGGILRWADASFNDVILYKGKQKIKLFTVKGGANIAYLKFTISKPATDVPFSPTSGSTNVKGDVIYANFNKPLDSLSLAATGFTCKVNNNAIPVNTVKINSQNSQQCLLNITATIADTDKITLSYNGNTIKATDGSALQAFTDLAIDNNLPFHFPLPGRIEAEDFFINQGLGVEPCEDINGGRNIGYSNAGDFLTYRVRVPKKSSYNVSLRVASFQNAGRVEVQQLDKQGNILYSVQLNVPVTGGWQIWTTITATMQLEQGESIIRVLVLKPEFNLNWLLFAEKPAKNNPDPNAEEFGLYPNPADNLLKVKLPKSVQGDSYVSVYSVLGGLVMQQPYKSGAEATPINISNIPNGIYIVKLENNDNTWNNKLLISKM